MKRPLLLCLLLLSPPARAAAPPVDGPALAARVDRHLAERLARADAEPAGLVGDAAFLRRASLDLIGRIPTPAEVRAFLADRRSEKRARLVERLLASPGYARHWANVWRRQLLPQAGTPELARLAGPFEDWLQDRLAARTPYDRLAREVLAAPLTARGGATAVAAFLQAGEYKPENVGANAARAFLGLNLDCAQCHNHPFARWTKQQFWEFAAFFAPPKEISDAPPQLELLIPQTTKVVTPKLLTGDAVRWPAELERDTGRKVLADWATAEANPYFARNAVNRVWAQLFGAGLVEPLDDVSSSNPASHPELLDELSRAFVASGHDLTFLLRVLTATKAYQRSSAGPPADERLFATMPVRGLSGEQLYDSLRVATGLPLDAAAADGPPSSPRRQFAQRFQTDRPAKAQRSVLQALELMNGQDVRQAVLAGKMLAAVADAPFLDGKGQVEALFLAALGRPPTADEAGELVSAVASGDRRERLGDLFWALLNSTEFSVNH